MNAVIVAVCALGFLAAMSPTVDAFLSTVFVWVFSVGGGVALIVVLVREMRDWSEWMRITRPMPRPVRVKRAGDREEAGRP